MIHIFNTRKNIFEQSTQPIPQDHPSFHNSMNNEFEYPKRYIMKTVVQLSSISAYRKINGFNVVDPNRPNIYEQSFMLELIVNGHPMMISYLTNQEIEEFEEVFMAFKLEGVRSWKQNTEDLLFEGE